MLTAHCRRAAGLSFLQINGPTYYFPNCPLAQLAVWGSSSPGRNTVALIPSRRLLQPYAAAFVPNCACVVMHLHTLRHWNLVSLNRQNLKGGKTAEEQINSDLFQLFDQGEGHRCATAQFALVASLSSCYS